jgi:hypothetical protein
MKFQKIIQESSPPPPKKKVQIKELLIEDIENNNYNVYKYHTINLNCKM